jgi:hypothetical protein
VVISGGLERLVVTRGVPVVTGCVPVVNSGVPIVPISWGVGGGQKHCQVVNLSQHRSNACNVLLPIGSKVWTQLCTMYLW